MSTSTEGRINSFVDETVELFGVGGPFVQPLKKPESVLTTIENNLILYEKVSKLSPVQKVAALHSTLQILGALAADDLARSKEKEQHIAGVMAAIFVSKIANHLYALGEGNPDKVLSLMFQHPTVEDKQNAEEVLMTFKMGVKDEIPTA
jgi:hypothetical protein